MVQIVRVLKGRQSPPSVEQLVKSRFQKMQAILSKSERMVQKAIELEKQGKESAAKMLRKRARDAVRMSMKTMGILMVEFGMDLPLSIGRARAILKIVSNGRNGSSNSHPPS
jgi:hypothetical protein